MSLLLSVAAAAAAATTAGAYLDAKFHLGKDLAALGALRRGNRSYAQAVAKGRGNAWFVFEDTVERYPHMVAVWTRDDGIYTYRELHWLAGQFARFFLSRGAQRGDLVALYLQNRPEFLVAWLALLSIGCAPAAINYHLTGDALVHSLRISGAKLVLVDEDPACRARIDECQCQLGQSGMSLAVLDDSLRHLIRALPENPRPSEKAALDMSGDFPAILLYTSGTTGLPKGCAFTMARLYTGLEVRRASVGDAAGPDGDRWYSCMPLYHGTSAISMMVCLVTGVGIAMARRFSVRGFWPDIRDSQATVFVYVGETARYLLNAPPSRLDRQHRVRCMYGNGLRPDVWEQCRRRFGIAEVGEFFNSTEGVFGLFNLCRGPFLAGCVGHHGLLLRRLLHNVYVPVEIDEQDNTEIRRDAATGHAFRAPYAVGGEILVAMPDESAFQGYWRNDRATDRKFARDVFRAGDLYYRSGDALRRDSDGRWFFLDRLGDTFRWKSENVSTAEVAQVLGHFPGVVEANVYGVRVPNHEGRAGCAALQLDSSDGLGGAQDAAPARRLDSLAEFALARLPRYAVPVFLRLVSAPIHIHNYKQSKVLLREQGVDPALTAAPKDGKPADRILWLKPGSLVYVDFLPEDWHALHRGTIQL